MFRAASAKASLAATRANLALRSMWRRSFDEMCSSGLKFLTSPPMRTSKPLASKSVRVSMPEHPATRLLQDSATLLPTGVTAPIPVTTTRRRPRGSAIGLHYRGSRELPGIELLSARLLAWAEQRNHGVVQADRLDVAADAPD